MTDEDRCKRIAEFEYGPQGETYQRINPADYPHDLNATMRAARKLQPERFLEVDSEGRAKIIKHRGALMSGGWQDAAEQIAFADDDSARAAFLALSAYLETK
jgi:hypothetical protein